MNLLLDAATPNFCKFVNNHKFVENIFFAKNLSQTAQHIRLYFVSYYIRACCDLYWGQALAFWRPNVKKPKPDPNFFVKRAAIPHVSRIIAVQKKGGILGWGKHEELTMELDFTSLENALIMLGQRLKYAN